MTAQSNGAADAALRDAEERIFRAITNGDIPALAAELADDFVHTTIGGAAQDRGAFLEAIRTMPYRILELGGEGIQVRVMGEIAVLSGVQRARVNLPDGAVVSGATAFVDVFQASGAGWRLRQACSVEMPAASSEPAR